MLLDPAQYFLDIKGFSQSVLNILWRFYIINILDGRPLPLLVMLIRLNRPCSPLVKRLNTCRIQIFRSITYNRYLIPICTVKLYRK